MLAPRNTTNIGGPLQTPLTIPDCQAQTRLGSTVLKVESSAGLLRSASSGVLANTTGANPELHPPVLDRTFYASRPEFIDQAHLDTRWASLKEYLIGATLQEQEILDVLTSGILQTNTGKAISGLFENAVIRSIRDRGTLSEARLKTIVDALCHLPPGQWQAALGEQARFSSDHRIDGVMAFIQSRLDASSAERDEKIAQKQWVSDAQWNAIKEIALNVGHYARPGNKALHSAVLVLKDDLEVRPSVKDAQHHLNDVKDALREPLPGERRRWSDSLIDKVEAVSDQLEAGYSGATARPDTVKQDELISLRFYNTPKAVPSGGQTPSLLENLQGFEHHANFYTNVNATGTPIPEGFFARFLYACNVLDTFDALRLDASHITTKPAPPSGGDAWKNGASDFTKSPFEPGPERTQSNPSANPLISMGQFAAQVDEVLNQIIRNVVPWDSAHAEDVSEIRVLLESLRDQPATIEVTSDSPARYSAEVLVLREQLGSWLARMSGSLFGSGVAVLSRTRDLMEQNPGTTAGVFAAYMAVSNFCANWFLPEPEDAEDPLRGIEIHPDPAPDERTVAHEYAIEGIEDLFEIFPDFADEVKRLINQSDYPDPADDPQLVENLEALVLQPVPGSPNVTYEVYLKEITEEAEFEAHEAFEDGSVSKSTTGPADTTQTDSILSDSAAHEIKKRSLTEEEGRRSNLPASISVKATLTLANSLIEAGQRLTDAEVAIRRGEEIEPGFTITQAADLFINDFAEMQTVLDSSLFILSSIERLVANSDLPGDLKSKINYSTTFKVTYLTPVPLAKHVDVFQATTRTERFTLAGLMTGQHERTKLKREEVTIHWPSGYTDKFKEVVKNADFSEDHEVRMDRVISRLPHHYALWKSTFDYSLKRLLTDYLENPAASALAKEVIGKFFRGEVQIRPVAIKNGISSGEIPVSDAIFLSNRGRSPEGLFVFLGGNETVIESPAELFRKGGKSIEQFPQLSSELSKRISLKDLLSRDDDDFKYSQGRSFLGYGSDFKWAYDPISIGRKDGPDRYGEIYDVRKFLFYTATVKARADMDTRTSTWDERLVDKLLEMLADFLKFSAILLGIPGAPTVGIAFMLGAAASAVKYGQGELNDDPAKGNRLKAQAIEGLVGQIAAPYIGQLLGRELNAAEQFRLTLKVYQLLKMSNSLPEEIATFLPEYTHHSTPLELSAKHMEKWIAPRVKNPADIKEKLTRKFTNKRVADRLRSLSKKGPQAAQRLMDRSRVLYFSGPKEGYVYRGFTMCGDSRSPQEVFTHGLKTNGPVKNIQDINGMNANNGVNDGVQASGYYDDNGLGAFHEGGRQGGYTYLIDGREMDGYDVARNRNWQADAESRAGSNPYRIAYAQDIPGEKMLGAYDSAGKFIANQGALNRAIGKSRPDTDASQVPLTLKPLVHAKNATHVPL